MTNTTNKKFASVQMGVANTPVKIYTAPDKTLVTTFISIINTQKKTVKVSLAISKGTSPVLADCVEFNSQLLANATMSKDGMVLSPGETIWAASDNRDTVVRVDGIEINIGRIALE